MNIILIGMRGAGKSKISRRLSVLTKRDVLSSDLLIQYDNAGKSIPEILADNAGDWRAFRDMEYATLQKICALDGNIIDCGGGIIVDVDEDGSEIYSERKIELLRQNGRIVWLKGDIPRLAAKVKGDAKRPSLSETKSAEEVMMRRLPFYEKAADIIIDIENLSKKELTAQVHEEISKYL
ncbi:Shikimate kinase [Candidatus Terasakiella magnetica]|uniref:Shikimate kinase n=1 Tax=Candidatus Terasakiella magnetica TaxID=1867952 RepID=A0A1C3RJA1_9PROT|nr:shikimate kinase [Candidatus Terasakiella magnetica]SCA57329.1 Shikimate kinase [Candidatus Terasakiella magnetica]